jgi:epsin
MNLSALSNISIASISNSIAEVRAQVYPRNETERKVYEALSSKNWGASTTLMNEIAGETFDLYEI